jgi:hypothetical protein
MVAWTNASPRTSSTFCGVLVPVAAIIARICGTSITSAPEAVARVSRSASSGQGRASELRVVEVGPRGDAADEQGGGVRKVEGRRRSGPRLSDANLVAR